MRTPSWKHERGCGFLRGSRVSAPGITAGDRGEPGGDGYPLKKELPESGTKPSEKNKKRKRGPQLKGGALLRYKNGKKVSTLTCYERNEAGERNAWTGSLSVQKNMAKGRQRDIEN